MINTTNYDGMLEIDHDGGVLYFRTNSGITLLRITHLHKPTPHDVRIDMVAVVNLVSYIPVNDSTSGALERSLARHPSTGRYSSEDPEENVRQEHYIPTVADYALAEYITRHSFSDTEEPEHRCTVCGNVHDGDGIQVGWKRPYDVLYPGHEYVLTTKTSIQKFPREWRMGFIGPVGEDARRLQFSARGPDRSHSDQYGGTQVLWATEIKSAKEVIRDDKERQIGQRNLVAEVESRKS